MTGKPRSWSEQQELEEKMLHRLRSRWVRDLAATSDSMTDAARGAGILTRNLRRFAKRYGVKFSLHRVDAMFSKSELIAYEKAGVTIPEIAELHGCSPVTVQVYRRDFGLTKPRVTGLKRIPKPELPVEVKPKAKPQPKPRSNPTKAPLTPLDKMVRDAKAANKRLRGLRAN